MPTVASFPLPILIPLLYGLTSVVLLRTHAAATTAWQAGRAATATAVVACLALLPALSGPRLVMLPLITILGGLILHFSTRYLDGAVHNTRYVAWFLLTLAGASLVVSTGDLVVLALAWTLTSLALHQVLSLGDARPATALMAHKKFILSRIADIAILGGVALLVASTGHTRIAAILEAVPTAAAWSPALRVATILLAIGVILRSAQVPVHGWLLQVMEAPTPVSALLHTGIVNLGAFVLIVLAPLMGAAASAQTLLVIAGTATAVLAALAMAAQSNVKGTLAWSTCAQMGFVLIECGLGAYDLALVHLVAHALYKAHAFLNSGRAVRTATLRAPQSREPHPAQWVAATLASLAMVGGVHRMLHGSWDMDAAAILAVIVVAGAVAPALAQLRRSDGLPALAAVAVMAVAIPALYAVWHLLLAPMAPARVPVVVPRPILLLAGLAFAGLYLLHLLLTRGATDRVTRTLYAHAVHGFHLDTLFTRLTVRLWPPKRFRAAAQRRSTTVSSLNEQAA